ncbi:MAG: hypothetical protein HQL31_09500, partial [Planctomycetes bacterium]|nr:hypothetical protein [Planctomycetota bacterium]
IGLCKYSLAILTPYLFLATILLAKAHGRRVIGAGAAVLAGGLFMALPWLAKNVFTHGMPLFPFVIEPALVPSGLPSLFECSSGGTETTLCDKLIQLMRALFFSKTHQNYFRPYFFAYLSLLPFVLFPIKRKLAWIFACLALWTCTIMLFTGISSTDIFRYALPAFCLALIASAWSLSEKSRRLQILGTALAALSLLYTLSIHGRFLPALRYHLGRQSLHDFYDSFGFPFAALANSDRLRKITCVGKLAVFSLNEYHVKHTNALYIGYSKPIDGFAFEHLDEFMSALNHCGVEKLLIEKKIPGSDPFEFCRFNARWIKMAIKEERLEILDQSPYHWLLKNPEYFQTREAVKEDTQP